jgi:hypothetical protein
LWQHGEQTRIWAPARHAEVDRVIGRRVARVQRDHDVDRVGRMRAQVAGDEAEAAQPARSATPLQNPTRSGRNSTPVTFRRDAEAPAHVLVDGEGQVALAGAVVDDAQRCSARAAGLVGQRVERVVENLDELVDLAPLARHRRHRAGGPRR